MKKIATLGLMLLGLLGATLPTEAASSKKVKPNGSKPIERTRRHLHRESMQRVHRARAHR